MSATTSFCSKKNKPKQEPHDDKTSEESEKQQLLESISYTAAHVL